MTRVSLFVAALLLAVFATPSSAARPRLGVLIVFDQMPMWLFQQGQPFYGAGGFGGLDGAVYDAWYPYAGTETAPGHATLSTCAAPSVHGIATNTWFHEGKPQYVTDDDRYPILAPTDSDATAKLKRGSSPQMLLVPTLADAIKYDSGGRAKVVTLSHKDRSAILTAGRSGDLAVWYDRELGRYTTSTAYKSALPDWLRTHGASLPATTRETAQWSPLPVPKGKEALIPRDDRPGEGAMLPFGAVFPHNLTDIDNEDTKKSLYRCMPQSIDDLFALALLAVEHEGLGQDDEPDLLVVSVSTTDVVGHNYGGDSLEALDTLRRADQSLRKFVTALRSKVRGDIVFALSSDHGAPPLPQTMSSVGLAQSTITYEEVVDTANQALTRIGTKARVQGFFPPQLFIDFAGIDARGVDAAIAAVKNDVEKLSGIAHVYDMRPGTVDEDAFHPAMRLSAPPSRAAWVFVRQEPRVVLLEKRFIGSGTDHGSVYHYDRRVPFVLQGAGVKRGRFAEPADIRDVAASLAFVMGVSPPDACQGKPVRAAGP